MQRSREALLIFEGKSIREAERRCGEDDDLSFQHSISVASFCNMPGRD